MAWSEANIKTDEPKLSTDDLFMLIGLETAKRFHGEQVIASLRKRLDELQAANASVATVTRERDELKSRNATLGNRNSELEKALTTARAAERAAREALAQVEAQLAEAKNEIARLSEPATTTKKRSRKKEETDVQPVEGQTGTES